MFNPPGRSTPNISRQAAQEAAIQGAIQQLSMRIYERLAVELIASSREDIPSEALEELARSAMKASQTYFLAIGAIREDKGNGEA
jgi:hypothetical protein